MSIRDMVNYLQGNDVSIIAENSLLDAHAKLYGTPEQLPDREDLAHHTFGHTQGWGHEEPLHQVPTRIQKLVPEATTAHKLYGPSRYVMHSPQGSTVVHNDEPDFHTIDHELAQTVNKVVEHQPGRFRQVPLHTDILHKQTFKRWPEENASDFSHRVSRGMENVSINLHNDMHENIEHEVQAMSFDPLEHWDAEEKPHNEFFNVGGSGNYSHNVDGDARLRHGQIAHDFSHHIKVRK